MKLARVANPLFQQTLDKLSVQPLSLRVAFKLKGLTTKAREEYSKFEELRRAGLERHGKKGEDGRLLIKDETAQFEKEGLEAFVKEIQDLGDTDIELGQIKLSELGDKVELSAEELSVLEDIIVDG